MVLRTKLLLMLYTAVITSFLVVLYVGDYNGYSENKAKAFSRPGNIMSNTFIITLKNEVSLESFITFLESHGLSATEYNIIHGLVVTIPNDKTIGELKEILVPNSDLISVRGKENMRLTDVTEEGCALFKANPNVTSCDPGRQGGPALHE
jgi:hypothetical protein